MGINDLVLKKWQELQSQYNYPVDSFGARIKDNEEGKHKIWTELGMYAYMKK